MRGGMAGLADLVTRRDFAADYSSRDYTQVDTFIIHHAASGSLEGTVGMMRRGERGGLSATFVVDGDQIVYVTPIDHRPHTSASREWDARAITVETINSAVGDASGWPISEASYRSLARIAAWMDMTYPAFRLDRQRVIGHRELYERHGASYPTACPGGIDVDRVVRMAREITSGRGFLNMLTDKQQIDLARQVASIEHGVKIALEVLGRLDVHRWREEQQPAVRDAVASELKKAGLTNVDAIAERVATKVGSTLGLGQ